MARDHMLINIPFYDKDQNPEIQMIDNWKGGLVLKKKDPQEGEIYLEIAELLLGETGIYWGSKILEYFLEKYSDYKVIHSYEHTDKMPSLKEKMKYIEEWSGYGVADSVEQIKEAFPQFWWSERTFILILDIVKKGNQPSRGGWRWEKWGPYIGVQESRADYLYDEPDIDEILTFSFIEVAFSELHSH